MSALPVLASTSSSCNPAHEAHHAELVSSSRQHDHPRRASVGRPQGRDKGRLAGRREGAGRIEGRSARRPFEVRGRSVLSATLAASILRLVSMLSNRTLRPAWSDDSWAATGTLVPNVH